MANTLASVAKVSYEQTVGKSPLSIDAISNNIDVISTNVVPISKNIDASSSHVVPNSNNTDASSSHVVPISNNIDRDVQNSRRKEELCRKSVKEIDFDETNRCKDDLVRPIVDGNISHFENGIIEPDRNKIDRIIDDD